VCEYCELPLPAERMEDHVFYCGARTDVCRTCGRYIMLKDRIQHASSSCASFARSLAVSASSTMLSRYSVTDANIVILSTN
jgi:hypothetical protein